jgi:Coenzyme F420-dependent N5,N10-methylene tetrahydromethanopterin reductase and related flavin-dependent oxidoreductases
LARLYGDRIDLGLGRAPGTDQFTLRAIRRPPEAAEHFPEDVIELQAYFEPAAENQRLEAVPAAGTRVPLWILGSSHFGAMLAASSACPTPSLALRARPAAAGARHLSQPLQAVGDPRTPLRHGWREHHRRRHRRGSTAAVHHAADVVAGIRRGARGLSKPPIDDIDSFWTPEERADVGRMLARSIVGSPETVRRGLEDLAGETGPTRSCWCPTSTTTASG